MANSVSINPMLTTTGAGLFDVVSDGLVAGVAFDDPAIRYALAGGVLATSETLPMWGGLPIFENIPASTSNGVLGSTVGRAADYAHITGWSVYNQAHNMITTPQSTAPTVGGGGSVNFYRAGSGARIAVPIDPALVSLDGGLITQQVSWDFTANQIIAFSSTALPVKILYIAATNCKRVVYDNVNNVANWNTNGACAVILV